MWGMLWTRDLLFQDAKEIGRVKPVMSKNIPREVLTSCCIYTQIWGKGKLNKWGFRSSCYTYVQIRWRTRRSPRRGRLCLPKVSTLLFAACSLLATWRKDRITYNSLVMNTMVFITGEFQMMQSFQHVRTFSLSFFFSSTDDLTKLRVPSTAIFLSTQEWTPPWMVWLLSPVVLVFVVMANALSCVLVANLVTRL